MDRLYIDLETYSPTPIDAGVYRYTEDSDFRILMAAWSVDGREVLCATGEDNVRRIPGLFNPHVIKVAHNAQFERVCLSHLAGMPVGQYLDPEAFHDTQAVAGELGYPQRLEALAIALGADLKDSAGTRLIRLFSMPNRQGKRVLPEDKPDEWLEFVNYCKQDVRTLIDVDKRLGDWPTETERAIWIADQHINDAGMSVDRELAQVAMEAAETNQMEQELELATLTGVANPGSPIQVLTWLQDAGGIDVPNLQAATVERALGLPDLHPTTRRVLELRQELALVASKKFGTALGAVSADGRLRGGFRFFGAHTGRWAGRGVQPHNLPRAALDSDAETEAAIVDLKLGLGADAQTLKALVRALFVGPFTVVDYAAIEARVIAWLADEEWALKAFHDGRDIYVETAERMGGLTRAQGKVAVLALGYNGGINSLRAMGATGDDAALQYLVTQWRRANPSIVQFWQHMEQAFRLSGQVSDHVSVERDGADRYIKLPSGRSIAYHNVRFTTVDTPYGPRPRASFTDPRRGFHIDTYGGRLAENVTQAVARGVLAEALARLDSGGYRVVGHVHDEIIVEGEHSVDTITRVMTDPPSWAVGLPIGAAGFTCARYRKG